MQAWSGIKTPEQFLLSLSNKIAYSRKSFNDTLSFTELSKESAGKYETQYGNVYMKGALISACLDLYLLKLSNAQYGLRQLKHDLGIKYGKDKYFEDDSLFNIITELTYPEVKPFFEKYVIGTTALPYEQFFAYAGVEYFPELPEDKRKKHILRFLQSPNPMQDKIRNAWLNNHAPSNPAADSTDVTTIDAIVKALYDVISGPAGPRNWKRFNSLFHPDAYMAAIGDNKKLQKFSPSQYAAGNAPYFLKNDFTEKEIGRTTNQFGNIAQVFTTYEYVTGMPAVTQRGINSVELIKENSRWYIMSVSWDEENKEQPLPEKFLKSN
jgi:hypothetical protein